LLGIYLNIRISKITLLIRQDSHCRTHLIDATSAVKYSPERKKNESLQNVTRRTERWL